MPGRHRNHAVLWTFSERQNRRPRRPTAAPATCAGAPIQSVKPFRQPAAVVAIARLYLQMTDVSPKEVKLDMPVALTFRTIHEAGGTPNYY